MLFIKGELETYPFTGYNIIMIVACNSSSKPPVIDNTKSDNLRIFQLWRNQRAHTNVLSLPKSKFFGQIFYGDRK